MTEKEYLSLVEEKLNIRLKELDEKISGSEKDIGSMHEYFWDNYGEFDEYGYEQYDNSKALESSVLQLSEFVKQKHRYEKMLDSPYFGRIDFVYDGEDEPESFYIGIGNFREAKGKEPLVYDWRAPISSLFYDYDKGEASFVAPIGEIKGEITRKKQYKIKHGKLIFELENEININDEILQQALSENANAYLKSIVTTIQKEQNSIIRDKNHRILAVQGCAGSGKTSVAMHRIAYLLYHNRKNLSSAQVMILSPNGVFSDYISRILPELGEDNINEMTLDTFAYHELREFGEAEDRYDEIERKLSAEKFKHEFGHEKQHDEAAYKGSRDYVKELDGFIMRLEYEAVDFKDFEFGKIRMKEEKIAEFFYDKFPETPIFSRMRKIADYLIDEYETLTQRNMDEEDKYILIEKMEKMYESRDLLKIYNRFLKEQGKKTIKRRYESITVVSDDEEEGRTTARRAINHIPYEDVFPMLYLKYKTVEPPEKQNIRHLLIDEMQDYSYLQYRLIDLMFDCPMTILGDKAQTIDEKHQDVLKFLPEIFGKDVFKVTLDKSYRSTTEINDFANSLIGADSATGVDRHGEEPLTRKTKHKDEMYELMSKDIEDCIKEDYDTIAVITQTQDEAVRVCNGLKKHLDKKINLMSRDTVRFESGICVVPFYLAKGLEFDAVLVPDKHKYVTDFHKQALYIEATRALHKLFMYVLEL
ncbi:MAG: AAA family ATPase [Lachnospiraceae bacterium]|nr:AAA family ATPase [Lachnospiraceae bacterium]